MFQIIAVVKVEGPIDFDLRRNKASSHDRSIIRGNTIEIAVAQDGIAKVLAGITTLEELLRVIEE